MSHAVRAKTEVSPVIQLMVLNDMINCAMAHNMTDSIGRSLDNFAQLPEYSIPLGRYSKVMCRGLQLLLEGDLQEATTVIGAAQRLIDSRVDSARHVTDHNLTMANLYYIRRMEDSAHTYLGQALATALHHQLPDICSPVILIAALLTYIYIRNRHLAASLRELVARYRASVNADEINTRLRHEYEETIATLRRQLDTCNQATNVRESIFPMLFHYIF